MGELIAVLSGKGGTGKTSICAGLATALAQEGKRVLAIDCDIGLRNLDISLGLSEGTVSFMDLIRGHYSLDQVPHHGEFPSLSFLTAPVNLRAEEVDPALFRELLQKARGQFDYILLDAPAGIDAGFALCARYADRIILVTGPDPAAVRDAQRAGQVLEHMGKEKIRLIVNRVDPRMFRTTGLTVDDVMDRSGLPLLGIVPVDNNVTLAAAFGKPLLLHSRRGPAAAAIRRITKRIQGLPVPVPTR